MLSLPELPLDEQTPQRLLAYFDSIGALLWDNTQKRSFAMYALGLLSPLTRKSVEPIAAHFTSEVDQADATHQRLLHFLADAPWPDDAVRLVAAGYGLAEMLRNAPPDPPLAAEQKPAAARPPRGGITAGRYIPLRC